MTRKGQERTGQARPASPDAEGALRLVVVESPYAGPKETLDERLTYARACLADSLSRGEAPFASHLLYTQEGVLRDEVPAQRKQGIEAGFAWGKCASLTALYADLGVSPGMVQGIRRAARERRHVEVRFLSVQDPRQVFEILRMVREIWEGETRGN